MAFDFDFTHHQSVLFTYPGNLSTLTTRVLNAEEKLSATQGSFGPATSNSRVVIKAIRKCNVTISQR
jgi:hypothetical protein